MALDSGPRPRADGNDTALQQLLSADQGEILDIIDTLRGYGITGELDLPLPQIVVCGDQSSGKSSVLEAISGKPFPKGENVCTTFPTELALRRSPFSTVSVRISPAPSRSDKDAARLANFDLKSNGAEGFETTVQSAKEFLRKESTLGADSYFDDVLHITVSQPSLPPLTLVDLPGIIHTPNSRQVEQDVDVVRNLVESYLENRNSIILAIITSQNDLEGQAILKMVKKVDPEGQRTLGIITKPDLLTQTPRREATFVKCAKNEAYRYELGWHVVKNQLSEEQPSKLADREREEKEFFANSVWKNALKPDQLGIANLRIRLSNLLEERTRPALPRVVKMIQMSLSECEAELAMLGQPRNTPREHAAYLAKISQQFQKLCEQSLEGTYTDKSFFDKPESAVDARRLRAAVSNLNDGFAAVMRSRGHQKEIVDETSDSSDNASGLPDLSLPVAETAHFSVERPEPVDRDDWVRHIEVLARWNKGSEQPGLPNYGLIPPLFQAQSERWMSIAAAHVEKVRNVVQEGLERFASHPGVSPPETSAALRRYLISAEMERRQKKALKQLNRLMKPIQRKFIITLDEDFLRTVQNLGTAGREQSDIDSAADDTCNDRLAEMSPSTASYILDYMLAYYKVAMRTFIDNVANLVIDQCLIDELVDVFTAAKVAEMDDELLSRLASESDVTRQTRINLVERVKKLQEALKICNVNSHRLPSRFPTPANERDARPSKGSIGTNELPKAKVNDIKEHSSYNATNSEQTPSTLTLRQNLTASLTTQMKGNARAATQVGSPGPSNPSTISNLGTGASNGGGLFGSAGDPKPSGFGSNGPFGLSSLASTTSNAPPAASVLTSTSSASRGGLFGSSSTTSAGSSGGVFANTSTAPPPFGFGSSGFSSGAFSQPSKASPSLFGNISTSAQISRNDSKKAEALEIEFVPQIYLESQAGPPATYQSITSLEKYQDTSFEELRWEGYQQHPHLLSAKPKEACTPQ